MVKTPFPDFSGVMWTGSLAVLLPCNVYVVVVVTREILEWKLCHGLKYMNNLRALNSVVFVPCKCWK